MIRAKRAKQAGPGGRSRWIVPPKWVLVGLVLAVVVGLLACGPAHTALHALLAGDSHADADGSYCTGCSLSGLELPATVCLFRPALQTLELVPLPPCPVPAAPPLLTHSPRGPPAHA